MANGFELLGDVLGGGIDRPGARLEGLLLGGKTQDALAKAKIRRDEAEQRLLLEENFAKLGFQGDTAAGGAGIARAGVGNVSQISGALGDLIEQATRGKIADPSATPGTGDINRQLASLASAPVPGVESVGAGLFTDIFGPEAGDLQVAPTGEATIEATRQRGLLSEARRLHPEQFRNVTNIGIPGDKPLGDILVESAIPGGGVPDDVEFGGATGVPGALKSIANIGVELANVIPFVDADIPFEETERATNALQDVAKRTILLLQDFVPGRPSNVLMENLSTFATDPSDILRGDQRSKLRLEQTRSFLANGIAEMQNLANNEAVFSRLTKSQQGKIVQQLPQAAALLSAYDRILSKFDAGPEGTIDVEGLDTSGLEIGETRETDGVKITRLPDDG